MQVTGLNDGYFHKPDSELPGARGDIVDIDPFGML